jgi:hypothetical protein
MLDSFHPHGCDSKLRPCGPDRPEPPPARFNASSAASANKVTSSASSRLRRRPGQAAPRHQGRESGRLPSGAGAPDRTGHQSQDGACSASRYRRRSSPALTKLSNTQARCLLWVKRRHRWHVGACQLCPQERTSARHSLMSAKGQKRTSVGRVIAHRIKPLYDRIWGDGGFHWPVRSVDWRQS